ncbi:MAG: pectate lyase [Paludibacter sp.]|nr:pectate lyase [Paludibacter sp.]
MGITTKCCNKKYFLKTSIVLVLTSFSCLGFAQKKTEEQKFTTIDYAPFSDNTGHWYIIADKHNMINALPDKPRYKPTEIENIADNMLLFQKNNGGWPKNYDYFAILTPEQKEIVKANKNLTNTTFDNGCTYTQIAALAIAYKATGIEKYKTGAIKGLEFVLKAQYANGGWPQYYPIEKDNYSSHITYNDDAMLGIMQLLKDILDGKPQYALVDNKLRAKLQYAYNKGLDCIIKTQIVDDGKPTAWCQQYDEVTLQPAWARKFEPPCICNKESASLVKFLMTINHPNKEVVNAIQNAVIWFDESIIHNTIIKTIDAPRVQTPYKISTHDRIVVIDSTAPAIWTRYYELKTHRPMFCNRDSKVVYSLSEVARERRDGYGWYNYEPQKVLNKYPKWQQKWAIDKDVLRNK